MWVCTLEYRSPQRPKEDAGSLGATVSSWCECWGTVQEQCAPLRSKSSPGPPVSCFWYQYSYLNCLFPLKTHR